MEITGRCKGISKDFSTNELTITFAINEESKALAEYETIKAFEKLNIKATKFRKKRSLDANAFMWILLSKMAEVLHTTKDEVYLQMLDRYGVFTHIIVKQNVVEKIKNEWRTVRELGEVDVNENKGIQLQCFFGSSTYDTKEMGTLLDGVVSECKELGIETITSDEIERMKAVWGVEKAV